MARNVSDIIQDLENLGIPAEEINQKLSSLGLKRPLPKGFVRRGAEAVVKSPTLPIAGGVGGAMLASPTGPGALIGGGLGAAGGEAFRQIGARALGLPAPKSSLGALKKIGTEGALGLAGEGLARGVLMTARGGAKLLAPVGRKAVDFLSATTGVKEAAFKTLAKKPGLIFKSSKKIGEQIGQEVDRALAQDFTPAQIAVKGVEDAYRTGAAGRNVAKKVSLKLVQNQPTTVSEVVEANRAINAAIQSAPKGSSQRFLLTEQKQLFVNKLAEVFPEINKLNRKFAEIKSVSQFRNIARLTKKGETSKLGAIFLSLSAANPLLLISSPAVVGGTIALGSAIGKGLASRPVSRPIANLLLRGAGDQQRQQ